MRTVYPRQTTTCLPIFSFLRAERAKRQRRPLLQQATSRFKLPTHRWKRSFQLGAFSGDANGNSLPTANKYLFADLFLFKSGEGDEATSPSFAVEMRGLMLPACCWKQSLQHRKCSGDANRSGLSTANNYLFADLIFFTDGEGDEATSPSFSAANKGNYASSALLEVLIATKQMQWGCEWERFTHGKQLPVCRSFPFYERRGRRGNVALFYNTLCSN